MPGFRRHGMTGRRFGWFLDPEESADDIAFRVRHTRGVEPTTDGWVFQHIVEPTMGLMVGSWRQAFGERLSLRSDEARLDLSAERFRLQEKRAAGERDADTLIDLDPETVSPDNWKWCYKWQNGGGDWDTWRVTDDNSSQLTDRINVAACIDGQLRQLERVALRFDTATADPKGRARQANLWLYYDAPGSDGGVSEEGYVSLADTGQL